MTAMKKMGRIAGFSALMLATGVMAFAAGQDQDQQQRPQPSLEKQVGDWTVVCYAHNGGNACHMDETLINKKTHMRVLGVGVRYFPAQKKSALEVTVPLNVALQTGATVSAGKYTSKTMQYAICVREGCQAITPIDDAMLKGLTSSGEKGKVNVADYNSGKKVAISFQLKGFADAYQLMVSSSQPATK